MEDTTLKKRNCRLVHCTFCEVFIVLVWLITGQKYKDMIMQYFIVSWWKIVIFYLGCLKCFTWDGQQSETAVFWGPARPKKAPQIWWKTQESYFFLYFWECVNMHFLLVSICVGRWELALFWKCVASCYQIQLLTVLGFFTSSPVDLYLTRVGLICNGTGSTFENVFHLVAHGVG